MPSNFESAIISAATHELKQELNKLPRIAKDLGVSFFKSRFRAQGWLDTTFQPWAKRKKTDKRRPGRAILMDRGKLRNSIRGEVRGTDIVFGSDVPYAKIHNEGGTIGKHARSETFVRNRTKKGKFKRGTTAGRGFSFKASSHTMPQRQFMGNSAHLNKLIIRKIETTVKKVFSNYK